MHPKIDFLRTCESLTGKIYILGSIVLKEQGWIAREPKDIDIYIEPNMTISIPGIHILDKSALYPGWDNWCSQFLYPTKRMYIPYVENVVYSKVCRGLDSDWEDIESCFKNPKKTFLSRYLINRYHAAYMREVPLTRCEEIESNWERFLCLFRQYCST